MHHILVLFLVERFVPSVGLEGSFSWPSAFPFHTRSNATAFPDTIAALSETAASKTSSGLRFENPTFLKWDVTYSVDPAPIGVCLSYPRKVMISRSVSEAYETAACKHLHVLEFGQRGIVLLS